MPAGYGKRHRRDLNLCLQAVAFTLFTYAERLLHQYLVLPEPGIEAGFGLSQATF